MIVVAHSGHWAVQLLYLAPLVALVVSMIVGKIREKQEDSVEETDDGGKRPNPGS